MKLGIDCRLLGKSTGIGQFTAKLVTELGREESPGLEIVLLLPPQHPRADLPTSCTVAYAPTASRILWANLFAPIVMRKQRLDLYHALDNLSLPILWPKGRTRYVLTIHDLIPVLFPEGVKARHRFYFRFAIRRLLRIANAIIVDSESTKRAILERFKVPEKKITVIYLGVDRSRFYPVDDPKTIKRIRDRYRIGGEPYILFVGNIEPRKNLGFLIQAYADLLNSGRLNPGIRLIIAGSKGPLSLEVLQLPSKLGVTHRVLFPGVIADEDLPGLYSGASLFAFPSLYEGFGFPVLEAMACGTPVITSNVSSLPEVAGDAAVLVNPTVAADLREAIFKVITDHNLRRELREKGFERVKRFSWEETAQKTWQVYKQVML